LAIVPEARKADAVYHTLHDEISTACPATILRQTAHACLFLDPDSAAKII
jgi:glucosamine-6-phosphate deaminase